MKEGENKWEKGEGESVYAYFYTWKRERDHEKCRYVCILCALTRPPFPCVHFVNCNMDFVYLACLRNDGLLYIATYGISCPLYPCLFLHYVYDNTCLFAGHTVLSFFFSFSFFLPWVVRRSWKHVHNGLPCFRVSDEKETEKSQTRQHRHTQDPGGKVRDTEEAQSSIPENKSYQVLQHPFSRSPNSLMRLSCQLGTH